VKKEVSAVNNTRSSLLFCFSHDEISAERDRIVGEFCSTVSLPGFRKGKVPRGVVLSKFANDIETRVKSALLNGAFDEAQKSAGELNLLAIVDFSIEDSEEGVICKLIFDLRPSIELPDYKSIPLEVFSEEVSDVEIEAELEHIRKRQANYNLVDREVRASDYVKVNYSGVLEDGSAIDDVAPNSRIYGKQMNTWEEAGNTEAGGVQAVIQGVIGHRVGDQCEVEQIFAADFSIPELAGKMAIYTFEILEIRERVDPELNGEFLKQYGVDSVDELKTRIGERLAKSKRTQGLVKQRDEIVHFLSSAAKFELPGSALDGETQTLVQAFVDNRVKEGIPAKYFEAHIDEISKNLLPTAEIRAKAGLMLDRIAEVEKIEIENRDLGDMLWQDSMLKKIDIEKYIRSVKSDRNLLIDLRTRTLRGKMLDFLVAINSNKTPALETEKEQEIEGD
jgi:trigger factor